MNSLIRLTVGIAGVALLGIAIAVFAKWEARQDQEQLQKAIATHQHHSTE